MLAGKITWSGYRRGNSVRIVHHKTGKQVTLALSDDQGTLHPEIEEFLSRVPRLGPPMVLTPTDLPKPYQKRRPNETIARVRKAAGLASDLTLAACCHGGLTELGDAELIEAEGMAKVWRCRLTRAPPICASI